MRGTEHARRGGEVGHRGDLGEAALGRAERRARVEAEPAEPQDEHAETEERHVVPGDRPRLAVRAVLAATRAEQQQRRQRARRAREVDHRRAGEVLHAVADLSKEAAAEDPVRDQRVDDRREDDRVDRIRDELDALERRAPDDRQRHRAEDELEEEERQRRAADGLAVEVSRQALDRVAELQEEAACRRRTSRRHRTRARSRHTHQAMDAMEKLTRILPTTAPTFLPREKPISRKAKPACMNITRHAATMTQVGVELAGQGRDRLFDGRILSQRA